MRKFAEAKGYVVVKGFPNKLIIMEKSTGKNFGSYDTQEEIEAALEALPPSKAVEPKKVEYVEWRTAAQPSAQPPKHCSQGFPGCICQEEDLFLFCAASKDCENRALCHGICSFHFASLKIFGDLTKYAAAKTEQMIAENDEKECSHGVGYHSYDAAKARYEAGVRTNIILKPRQMKGTAGVKATVDLGILGANIRQVGDLWVVIDKDGNVLSRHLDRSELIKEFLSE